MKYRSMSTCWAPGCRHYKLRQKCKFYSFPKDDRKLHEWTKCFDFDGDVKPGSVICSCHFPEGSRKNGPQFGIYKGWMLRETLPRQAKDKAPTWKKKERRKRKNQLPKLPSCDDKEKGYHRQTSHELESSFLSVVADVHHEQSSDSVQLAETTSPERNDNSVMEMNDCTEVIVVPIPSGDSENPAVSEKEENVGPTLEEEEKEAGDGEDEVDVEDEEMGKDVSEVQSSASYKNFQFDSTQDLLVVTDQTSASRDGTAVQHLLAHKRDSSHEDRKLMVMPSLSISQGTKENGEPFYFVIRNEDDDLKSNGIPNALESRGNAMKLMRSPLITLQRTSDRTPMVISQGEHTYKFIGSTPVAPGGCYSNPNVVSMNSGINVISEPTTSTLFDTSLVATKQIPVQLNIVQKCANVSQETISNVASGPKDKSSIKIESNVFPITSPVETNKQSNMCYQSSVNPFPVSSVNPVNSSVVNHQPNIMNINSIPPFLKNAIGTNKINKVVKIIKMATPDSPQTVIYPLPTEGDLPITSVSPPLLPSAVMRPHLVSNVKGDNVQLTPSSWPVVSLRPVTSVCSTVNPIPSLNTSLSNDEIQNEMLKETRYIPRILSRSKKRFPCVNISDQNIKFVPVPTSSTLSSAASNVNLLESGWSKNKKLTYVLSSVPSSLTSSSSTNSLPQNRVSVALTTTTHGSTASESSSPTGKVVSWFLSKSPLPCVSTTEAVTNQFNTYVKAGSPSSPNILLMPSTTVATSSSTVVKNSTTILTNPTTTVVTKPTTVLTNPTTTVVTNPSTSVVSIPSKIVVTNPTTTVVSTPSTVVSRPASALMSHPTTMVMLSNPATVVMSRTPAAGVSQTALTETQPTAPVVHKCVMGVVSTQSPSQTLPVAVSKSSEMAETRQDDSKTSKTAEAKSAGTVEPKSLGTAESKTSKTVECKTSKTGEPRSPKTAEPRSPKTVEPRSPKTAEPRSPKTAEPRSPKTAEPRTSKTAEPRSPKTAEPRPPKTAEPRTSKTAEPRTSKTAEPRTSKTAEPRTSKTAEPRTSKTAEPRTSKTAEPRSPKTAKPRSPKAAEPRSPKAAEPRSPKAAEPRSPKAAEPRSPKAAEPKSEKAMEPVAATTTNSKPASAVASKPAKVAESKLDRNPVKTPVQNPVQDGVSVPSYPKRRGRRQKKVSSQAGASLPLTRSAFRVSLPPPPMVSLSETNILAALCLTAATTTTTFVTTTVKPTCHVQLAGTDRRNSSPSSVSTKPQTKAVESGVGGANKNVEVDSDLPKPIVSPLLSLPEVVQKRNEKTSKDPSKTSEADEKDKSVKKSSNNETSSRTQLHGLKSVKKGSKDKTPPSDASKMQILPVTEGSEPLCVYSPKRSQQLLLEQATTSNNNSNINTDDDVVVTKHVMNVVKSVKRSIIDIISPSDASRKLSPNVKKTLYGSPPKKVRQLISGEAITITTATTTNNNNDDVVVTKHVTNVSCPEHGVKISTPMQLQPEKNEDVMPQKNDDVFKKPFPVGKKTRSWSSITSSSQTKPSLELSNCSSVTYTYSLQGNDMFFLSISLQIKRLPTKFRRNARKFVVKSMIEIELKSKKSIASSVSSLCSSSVVV